MADSSVKAAKTTTVVFHGLCLFGRSPDRKRIHVFLAQPAGMGGHAGHGGHAMEDMKHVTTVWTPNSPGAKVGKAERHDHGWKQEYGTRNETVTAMPGENVMANLTTVLGASIPEPKVIDVPRGAHASHVTLHGGKLEVQCPDGLDIGIWLIGRKTWRLPFVVAWTNAAKADDASETIHVYHAVAGDSPTPGNASPYLETRRVPDDPEERERQARIAAAHYAAYFELLGITDPPEVRFTFRYADCTGAEGLGLQTVLSCPAGLVTLD